MAVKIRLARGGAKKRPYYRVVVAEVSAPRDGAFLEKVGTYNPMLPKDSEGRIILNNSRVEHWLNVGAKPTERVAKFIENAGIVLPNAIKRKMEIKLKNRKLKPSKKEMKKA